MINMEREFSSIFNSRSRRLFSRAFIAGINRDVIERSAEKAKEATQQRRVERAEMERPGGLDQVTVLDLVGLERQVHQALLRNPRQESLPIPTSGDLFVGD